MLQKLKNAYRLLLLIPEENANALARYLILNGRKNTIRNDIECNELGYDKKYFQDLKDRFNCLTYFEAQAHAEIELTSKAAAARAAMFDLFVGRDLDLALTAFNENFNIVLELQENSIVNSVDEMPMLFTDFVSLELTKAQLAKNTAEKSNKENKE